VNGAIATAFVSIKADTKGFKGQVESSVEDTAKSAGAKFAGIFGAVAFGAGLKRTIDAASRLEQAVGATATVFGQASSAVDVFAKNAAKGFGISESAARELTSQIGALLQNMGLTADEAASASVELAKLGADLAAAFGGNPEEAVEALGSALRGEMDPVERFGIRLNEATVKAKAFELGLYSGKGALDDNAKAQATLAAITEQTANVQGQFAREAQTAAGQTAIAKAEAEDAAASLGANFLPIYTKVVEIVGALASAFGSLPGPVQTAVVALLGITVLAGPLSGVASGIKGITTAVSSLSPAMRTLSLSMGAVGALVGIATIAYQVYSGRKKEAEQRTKDLAAALREEGEAQNAALEALVSSDEDVRDFIETMTSLGFTVEDVNQYVTDGTGPIANLADAYATAAGQTDDFVQRLYAIARAMGPVGTDVDEWYKTLDGGAIVAMRSQKNFLDELLNLRDGQLEAVAVSKLVSQATGEVGEAADGAAGSIEGQKEQAQAAAEATKQLEEALEPTRYAFDEAADAADALADAIDRVFGGSLDLESASRNLQQAGDDLAASFEENGATLDVFTEAGRNNRAAIQAQVESILDYGVAMVGAGQTTDEATEAVSFLTEGLREQLRQAGLTEEQIDEYLTTLGLTPENVTTSIELANEDVSKDKLEAILDDLGDIDAGAAAEIQALIDEGKYAEAQRRLRAIEAARSVRVDLVPGRGLTLSGVSGASRVFLSANGGYFPARSGGYMVNLAEAGQAEAVLPLERPSRLAEMLSDPRIGGPIAEAMGDGGGGGGVATITAAPATPMVVQFVVNDRVVQEMLVAADRQTRGAR
jgi:hypothetical protein